MAYCIFNVFEKVINCTLSKLFEIFSEKFIRRNFQQFFLLYR